MRRILTFIIAATIGMATATAQNNSDRIGIGFGGGYAPKAETVLFWEHETSYHNAWEAFLYGSLALDSIEGNLWNNGKTWGAGAAWKPCVVRSRNNYGSVRLAAMLGAAPRDFSAGLTAGYQHSYVLRGGWQLYWQGGVTLTLPRRGDLFGVAAGIGVKMPVRDRMRGR